VFFVVKILWRKRTRKVRKVKKGVKCGKGCKCERFTCLDAVFKNNDQLKTNTALQMEAEGIEFKVI